jgi:serine/threonine protein kinase
MQYLESIKIVHRDLSLRNLLVSRNNGKIVVKVSDLGLSRSMEKNYYRAQENTIAIRWSAPETLEYGICDSKSDVYSFGIVL